MKTRLITLCYLNFKINIRNEHSQKSNSILSTVFFMLRLISCHNFLIFLSGFFKIWLQGLCLSVSVLCCAKRAKTLPVGEKQRELTWISGLKCRELISPVRWDQKRMVERNWCMQDLAIKWFYSVISCWKWKRRKGGKKTGWADYDGLGYQPNFIKTILSYT